MSRLVRPLLLVCVPIVAVAAALAVWLSGGRYVTTQNAYVKADIAHIASELDGRVASVLVDDHAHVQPGQVLVELESAPFEAALAKAQAEVDAARQQIKTLIATLSEARSELAEAEGRQAYFDAQVARQQTLAKRGIVSSKRLEDVLEEARRGRDRTRVMRTRLDRVMAQLGGDPDRPVDLHPVVREKLALLEQAQLDLDRTFIRAPVAGQVVNLRLQRGEPVEESKPLMAIVVADNPWVEANFKETELTHVRPGMQATITLDIDPGRTWDAEVASISPATGAEFALLPPQNASGNWVKVVQRLPVKLRIVGADNAAGVFRAGMTATVSVDTKRQRSLAQLLGLGPARAGRQSDPDSVARAAGTLNSTAHR